MGFLKKLFSRKAEDGKIFRNYKLTDKTKSIRVLKPKALTEVERNIRNRIKRGLLPRWIFDKDNAGRLIRDSIGNLKMLCTIDTFAGAHEIEMDEVA